MKFVSVDDSLFPAIVKEREEHGYASVPIQTAVGLVKLLEAAEALIDQLRDDLDSAKRRADDRDRLLFENEALRRQLLTSQDKPNGE